MCQTHFIRWFMSQFYNMHSLFPCIRKRGLQIVKKTKVVPMFRQRIDDFGSSSDV